MKTDSALYMVTMMAATALVIAGNASAQSPAPRPQKITVVRASGSYLGVGVVEVDADRAKALHLKEERGVEVKNVDDDSPASKAGVKEGDVILDYNGQRVEGITQFVRMVVETPVGRKVNLGIFRNGSNQTLSATIAARANQNMNFAMTMPIPNVAPVPPVPPVMEFSMPDIPSGVMGWQNSTLGYVGEPVDGQLADFFGVKDGVLIRSVAKNSPADKAGLKAGDVITKVDGNQVKSPREITAVVRRSRDKKTLTLGIVRNKRDMTVEITPSSEWSYERMTASTVL
jgi:serine protease Do